LIFFTPFWIELKRTLAFSSVAGLHFQLAAINVFKAIYGYSPFAATAWDVARAIAYSGATR